MISDLRLIVQQSIIVNLDYISKQNNRSGGITIGYWQGGAMALAKSMSRSDVSRPGDLPGVFHLAATIPRTGVEKPASVCVSMPMIYCKIYRNSE